MLEHANNGRRRSCNSSDALSLFPYFNKTLMGCVEGISTLIKTLFIPLLIPPHPPFLICLNSFYFPSTGRKGILRTTFITHTQFNRCMV